MTQNETVTQSSEAKLTADIIMLDRLMMQASWVAHRRLAQRMKQFGLTVPQYMTLRAIQQQGDNCTMSEIADAAFQVAATVTGIIDRLEERGLVQRQPNPNDRRSLVVSLTAQGNELMSEVGRRKRTRLEQFFRDYSADQRETLMEIMHGYVRVMSAEVEEGD